MNKSQQAINDVLCFTIGLLIGITLMYGIVRESEPDLQSMRAEQAYEYCWRVDAYRQDAGMQYPRGHDDFRGIYDAVCGAERE